MVACPPVFIRYILNYLYEQVVNGWILVYTIFYPVRKYCFRAMYVEDIPIQTYKAAILKTVHDVRCVFKKLYGDYDVENVCTGTTVLEYIIIRKYGYLHLQKGVSATISFYMFTPWRVMQITRRAWNYKLIALKLIVRLYPVEQSTNKNSSKCKIRFQIQWDCAPGIASGKSTKLYLKYYGMWHFVNSKIFTFWN